MKDYARQDAGASIIMATSLDERFPPENILDGAESFGAEAIGTFWMTTGMFPQELVVALAKPVQVSQIVINLLNVKKLSVEKCDSDKPTNFEKVFEAELQSREGRLQTERHQVNIKAKFIKLILHSGYSEFAAVNRISVIGSDGTEPRGSSLNNNNNNSSNNSAGGSYSSRIQQPTYPMDDDEPAPARPAAKQAQRYDEPDEEEEEGGNNQFQPTTYGGGRTQDEFEQGAPPEDEF